MKTMTTEHQNYLRDLLGRRSKRLSGKRDKASQTESALCAEIGIAYFGLQQSDLEKKPKEDKPAKPVEDRSHRLAPKPEKPKAGTKPAAKPAPEVVAKPGPVAASPKVTIPDRPPATVRRVNGKEVH